MPAWAGHAGVRRLEKISWSVHLLPVVQARQAHRLLPEKGDQARRLLPDCAGHLLHTRVCWKILCPQVDPAWSCPLSDVRLHAVRVLKMLHKDP